MLANIANTVVGIWLVYTAVLNPTLMAGSFRILAIVAGVVIVILSVVARRTDYHVWHSNVTSFFGIALILIGAWNLVSPLAPIVNYWFAFWIGVLTAFVALWAALYRPQRTT
jgi:hypothetical protein